MARLALLSFLFVALVGVNTANPVEEVSLVEPQARATTESWTWENCGLDTDIIQLESIKITPDPPKPGEDLTVTVKGTATDVVEEGAVANVVVKTGYVKLLRKSFDLCEEARNANTTIQCPVEKGDYDITHTVALPKVIPRTKFSVAVQGYTVGEGDLLCLNLIVDFRMEHFSRLG